MRCSVMTTSPFFEKEKFRNEVGFVVYDGFPVSEGHCLIVSKSLSGTI